MIYRMARILRLFRYKSHIPSPRLTPEIKGKAPLSDEFFSNIELPVIARRFSRTVEIPTMPSVSQKPIRKHHKGSLRHVVTKLFITFVFVKKCH